MRYFFNAGLAIVLLVNMVQAQSVRRLDDRIMREMDSIITLKMSQNGLPGISVAVIYNGRVAYTKAAGISRAGVPAGTSTKYPIASVSKTITGIMAMRMVQNGDIGLNDLIRDYVGGYTNSGIRIRHLLCHQSGIGHYNNCPGGYGGAFSWAASLDVVRGCTVCMSPAGSGTIYSTYGTTLMGVIIERVGIEKYGKTYTQLYNEWIKDVAGLTNLTAEYNNSISNLALGYDEDGDAENGSWSDIGWKLPAGGFVGTAHDLAKFGVGVMNNSFINSTTSDTMWRQQATSGTAVNLCADGLAGNYGLAFRVTGSGDNLRIFHNGLNDHGYSSLLYLYPRKQAGIVLLTNQYGKTGVLSDIQAALESRILCPDDRDFSSTINWGDNWIYEASRINASNIITPAAGKIIYDAATNNEIILKPGFHAQAGVDFRAILDGCLGLINPY